MTSCCCQCRTVVYRRIAVAASESLVILGDVGGVLLDSHALRSRRLPCDLACRRSYRWVCHPQKSQTQHLSAVGAVVAMYVLDFSHTVVQYVRGRSRVRLFPVKHVLVGLKRLFLSSQPCLILDEGLSSTRLLRQHGAFEGGAGGAHNHSEQRSRRKAVYR